MTASLRHCRGCETQWLGISPRCPDCGRYARDGVLPFPNAAADGWGLRTTALGGTLSAADLAAIRDLNPTLEVTP